MSAKYRSTYSAVSLRCAGCQKPMSIASCTALGTESSWNARSHVSAFDSAVGRSARAVAARRTPVAVASRSRLGVDLRVPGGADGDQPDQERPPRVGVHLEALERA